MGDRANIFVVEGKRLDSLTKVSIRYGVYLYTHWGGSELPYTLQQALIRGSDRWADSPYLTRIIFSEMIKDDVLGTTGFGISTGIEDNEYPVLVVEGESCEVHVNDRSWTFDEYIGLDLESYGWKLLIETPDDD